MRVTNNMKNNSLVNSMMKNQSLTGNLQAQLASGNKLNSASDNPSAIPSVMNANEMLNKISTYTDNITYLNGEIEVAESTLGQITDQIQRVKTLTIEAANGTNSSEQLKLINDELKQIREQLVDLANTKYQNSTIFSGNKTGKLPYVIEEKGAITYNGTPANENYQRAYTIADGVTLSINVCGENVLGYSNLVSEGPPAVFEGQGIMHTINTLTTMLDSANPDQKEISLKLDELETAQKTVLAARTELGGAQTRLNLTQELHEENKITYSAIQENLQSIDIAKVISELSAQEVALQASLYVGSQVMDISLLDYV